MELENPITLYVSFYHAIYSGNLEVVKLLVSLPSSGGSSVVDPTSYNNEAVCLAAVTGHLEILKYLMLFPGVDICANDNKAICNVVGIGHLEVLKY